MNRRLLKNLLFLSALFSGSLLLMQFVWRIASPPENKPGLSAEKVNLALRRTGHYLLAAQGDSSSAIAPVQQLAANVWLLKLERMFSYDQLPGLLEQSFELHQISQNYDVAVLSCSDGELQLGYNYIDFKRDSTTPCGGRDMKQDCYNVQVTFPQDARQSPKLPMKAWFFSGFIALLGFVMGRWWEKKGAEPPLKSEESETTEWIQLGNSRLDVANQVLLCGEMRQELTYREAKLLHLFAKHPNQLLERSFILQNVWADEGILVGRSVDMFVSRLRKALKEDASLRLTAVHGVGYRLEVLT
jgi:hypothetical protein